MKGFKFLEEVSTPRGVGLVIGKMTASSKGEMLLVAVRKEGEKGAGMNVMFGWCEAHELVYEGTGGCERCRREVG